jgi:hypothetical protein
MPLNEVIDVIRMSRSKEDARTNLVDFFGAAAPSVALKIKDQTKVEIVGGMCGVAKIFLHNATMEELEHMRVALEMPEFKVSESYPDSQRNSEAEDWRYMLYSIPDPEENIISKVCFWANSSENELRTMGQLEALLGPKGKEIANLMADAMLDGVEHREQFMKKLKET